MDDKLKAIDEIFPGITNLMPAKDRQNQLVWANVQKRAEDIAKYNAVNADRKLEVPEKLQLG